VQSQLTLRGDTIRSSVKHAWQRELRKLIGRGMISGDSRGERIYLLLGISLQEIANGGKSGSSNNDQARLKRASREGLPE
jgi:hypothetical protein